jgi:hypothetical protein
MDRLAQALHVPVPDFWDRCRPARNHRETASVVSRYVNTTSDYWIGRWGMFAQG